LTISDAYSRYLLRCQAVEKTDTMRIQAMFEAAFREYGMPEAIRTDNGTPFAACAIAGLSRWRLSRGWAGPGMGGADTRKGSDCDFYLIKAP